MFCSLVIQLRFRLSGQCSNCSKAAVEGRALCEEHLVAQRANRKRRVMERVESGL